MLSVTSVGWDIVVRHKQTYALLGAVRYQRATMSEAIFDHVDVYAPDQPLYYDTFIVDIAFEPNWPRLRDRLVDYLESNAAAPDVTAYVLLLAIVDQVLQLNPDQYNMYIG